MAKSLLHATALVLVLALLNLNLATSSRFLKSSSCHAAGYLQGESSHCSANNASFCCEVGKMYPQYHCSPPIMANTHAIMTINSFAKGGDGERPSESNNRCSLPKGGVGGGQSETDDRYRNIASLLKVGVGGGRSETDDRYRNIASLQKVGVGGSGPYETDDRFRNTNSLTKGGDGGGSSYSEDRLEILYSFSKSGDGESPSEGDNRSGNTVRNIGSFSKGRDAGSLSKSNNNFRNINNFRKGGDHDGGPSESDIGNKNIDHNFAKTTDGNRFGTVDSFAKTTDANRCGSTENLVKGTNGNRWGSPDNFAKTTDGNRSGGIDNFAKSGNSRGPSKCDNSYHSDEEIVVALSTGWYDGGSRCLKNIRINGNGKSVLAKVIDECDSVNGCDSDHDFRLPCLNNIVDASPAVWKALDIPELQVGNYVITWSDE